LQPFSGKYRRYHSRSGISDPNYLHVFCKIFDELQSSQNDLPEFRSALSDTPRKVANRIAKLFERVKKQYDDVFDTADLLKLDEDSINYIVGELQNFLLTGASRDAVGEAFEVFIGPAVRGEEGQFFTPRNVVNLIIDLVDPQPGEVILDPACGSGGFLVVALEHLWSEIEQQGKEKGWNPVQIDRQKRDTAVRAIRGIDKDAFLSKVTKSYMAVIGDGRSGIFCEDALSEPKEWQALTHSQIALGQFDCVITNPPFGSKIPVRGTSKLKQFALAQGWKYQKKADAWETTGKQRSEASPQILYIERCWQLLKPYGRMGMILPESIFGMPVYGYVVDWILNNMKVVAFISLPEDLFQPYTHAKTCVLIAQKTWPPENFEIQMAIADWCGHDSRGNPTLRKDENGEIYILDDIPQIAKRLKGRLCWEASYD